MSGMSYILDMTTHHSGSARPAADDDRVTPTTDQISRWASLTIIVASSIWYFATVLPQLGERSQPPRSNGRCRCCGRSAPRLSVHHWGIVVAIGAAIVAGASRRRDIRDKQIERHGDRLAQAITAFGSAGVLVLVMLELDYFWIGNALYLVGAIGATVGSIVRIRAYRGSFNG